MLLLHQNAARCYKGVGHAAPLSMSPKWLQLTLIQRSLSIT
jgi:hypothetical protein